MRRGLAAAALALAAALLAACGGGGGGSSSSGAAAVAPAVTAASTALYTPPAGEFLSAADVKTVLGQAVAEAKARNRPAVIAVTDRVGDVLAVYATAGAPKTAHIPNAPSGQTLDLEGADVPASLAAIAKAVTGAYLSSGGNAFSTRTASEIVQPHFPPSPGALGLPGGPLFGVQFSQLPCSDVVTRYAATSGPSGGPRRSPLGLSADPGGLPLYKNGVLVGGIGVEADGVYGFDPDVTAVDSPDDEELIAQAPAAFAAPAAIRADQISVNGTTLAYVDRGTDQLAANPASAPAFDSLTAADGALTAVRGYYGDAGAAVLAGAPFGGEASGVRKAIAAESANPDVYVLTDGSGHGRYPVQAATDGAEVAQPLAATEVQAILDQAFGVMSSARAAIRRPLNSRAQVTITVTDTRGAVLGLYTAPDATLFGVDVSVQKARTAAFLSGPHAAPDLLAARTAAGGADAEVAGFVAATRAFLGDGAALTGATAFAERSVGDLSRPFFPDGQDGRPNGPLSYPIASWSPFATGLQSALVREDVVAAALYSAGAQATDAPARCAFLPGTGSDAGANRLRNGLQIFPGGVPIYRNGVVIGAVGVSGDGVDQDDMIAFLGLARAATALGGGFANAPTAIRADQLAIPKADGVRLRYVSCPTAPFLDSTAQNVCQAI